MSDIVYSQCEQCGRLDFFLVHLDDSLVCGVCLQREDPELYDHLRPTYIMYVRRERFNEHRPLTPRQHKMLREAEAYKHRKQKKLHGLH